MYAQPQPTFFVFPARAGMSRRKKLAGRLIRGVPRASGDEPKRTSENLGKNQCSPRERG